MANEPETEQEKYYRAANQANVEAYRIFVNIAKGVGIIFVLLIVGGLLLGGG